METLLRRQINYALQEKIMKKCACYMVLALMASMSTAQAAGETKTLKMTVNETLLQGYVATPPTGWNRNFSYGAASAVSDPVQKIFAISNQTPIGYPTTVPTTAGLSLISLATSTIISKENLPAAVQVTSAECTLVNPMNPAVNNVCPALNVTAAPSAVLPGRLIFTMFKSSFSVSTMTYSMKYWTYILDPAAAVGTADRWFLADSRVITMTTASAIIPNWFIASNSATTGIYLFTRASATSMRIYQITAK